MTPLLFSAPLMLSYYFLQLRLSVISIPGFFQRRVQRSVLKCEWKWRPAEWQMDQMELNVKNLWEWTDGTPVPSLLILPSREDHLRICLLLTFSHPHLPRVWTFYLKLLWHLSPGFPGSLIFFLFCHFLEILGILGKRKDLSWWVEICVSKEVVHTLHWLYSLPMTTALLPQPVSWQQVITVIRSIRAHMDTCV